MLPDRVTILATDALKPEEIDVPRAEQQLDRGQKMWNEAGESEEAYTEALRVIAEAEAKLASAAETLTRTDDSLAASDKSPAQSSRASC